MPATGASVTAADGTCTVVALPRTVVRDRDRWHRQTVTVTGEALARGGEGDLVAATTYRDRSVASGMCGPGPIVLYVTDIREARGSAE